MKKLFTLIAALFVVLSASATVEKDLITESVDLDNSSYGWYPGLVIDRANFTSAPVGTKLIIEYTLNSGDSHGFRLCTNYSNTPLPGFEVDDADHNYYPTADGSYSYEITQETIDLLNNTDAIAWDNVRLVGAGVTVNRIYLELADEEVIGTSINLDDSSYGWYPGYLFDRGIITSAEVGWHIVIDYTLNSGESHGFRLCTNYANTPLPGFEVDDADHNYNPTADGSYSYEITQETIDLLNDVNAIQYDNVRLVGAGVTVTALKLVRKVAEEGGEESTSMAIIYSEMKAGDFTVANATKNAESTDTKNVYDIAAEEELQFTLNAAPNVVFTITNSDAKKKAFIVNVNGDDTTDKGYVEFGGINGVVIFKDAKVGDVIKMLVAAKGSTAATIGVLPSTGTDLIESTVITLPKKAKDTEGADANGYVWKEFSFKVTEDMIKTLDGVKVVRVKETAGGYRCKAASINADLPTGIQNVKAADVKSANGAIYNLAGQKVNENYKGIVIKNGKKFIQK